MSLTFVKVRFGGERQWCRVIGHELDELAVRVENHPVVDGAPHRSEHKVAHEDILEWMTAAPTFHVVPDSDLGPKRETREIS